MKRWPNLLSLLGAGLLVAGVGCSTNPAGVDLVEGPEPVRLTAATGGSGATEVTPVGDSGTQSSKTVWISASFGGVIGLGRYALVIPADALDQSTSITMSIDDPSIMAVHFEPHGLQFLIPATLTMDYSGSSADGADPSTLDIYYMEGDPESWPSQGAVINSVAKTATAEIGHFSSFVFGQD